MNGAVIELLKVTLVGFGLQGGCVSYHALPRWCRLGESSNFTKFCWPVIVNICFYLLNAIQVILVIGCGWWAGENQILANHWRPIKKVDSFLPILHFRRGCAKACLLRCSVTTCLDLVLYFRKVVITLNLQDVIGATGLPLLRQLKVSLRLIIVDDLIFIHGGLI